MLGRTRCVFQHFLFVLILWKYCLYLMIFISYYIPTCTTFLLTFCLVSSLMYINKRGFR